MEIYNKRWHKMEYGNLKDLITPYIHECMQKRKLLVLFPDNKQLLEDSEAENWLTYNGIESNAERYHFRIVKDRQGNKGYLIKHIKRYLGEYGYYAKPCMLDVLVPFDVIDGDYDTFLGGF